MLKYAFTYSMDARDPIVLLLWGLRERSPPLSKIVHPSLPRLGRSQASTRRGAMHWPPPEGTTLLIMVSPVPGKLTGSCSLPTYILAPVRFDCGFRILRNTSVICAC